MYIIIWEYYVKAERIVEFEQIYHPEGAWAQLFKNEQGYLGTQFFSDEINPERYLTVDQWTSRNDYEMFRTKWEKEYEALDAQCEGLTKQEALLGEWETVNYETR